MKNTARNQLKELVKAVISEMTDADAKQSLKDEKTDQMKDSKIEGGNTEMKADSTKNLTPKMPTKPAPEGKKRPVVEEVDPSHFATSDELDKDVEDLKITQSRAKRAPTAPTAMAESVKKMILQVIREEIEEYRTKGALSAKNPNRKAPIKQYVKKGFNPNMGRPKMADPLTDPAEPGPSVMVTIDGEPLEQNFYDVPGRDIEKILFDEAFMVLGDKLGLNGKISRAAGDAIRKAQENGGVVELTFDRSTREVRPK